MAKINGTDMTIYLGADDILFSKTCTLNVEQDLPDSTSKGSGGDEEHINGVRRWSIDFDGAWDVTGNVSGDDLIALIVDRSADAVVKFGTTATAATGWTGNGTVQNMSISAVMEDTATYSGHIVGNGALAAI